VAVFEANAEIVKELGRLTGRRVSIIKGAKSKRKLIVIEGLEAKDLEGMS
jgi:uncharacterized protein YggU (UPF0235/DUF167 family)